jgi:hypothetical protein
MHDAREKGRSGMVTKFPQTAMKMKLCPLLVSLSLAILGPQATFGDLLEIDEVNGTLVGTYNGNPITLTLARISHR